MCKDKIFSLREIAKINVGKNFFRDNKSVDENYIYTHINFNDDYNRIEKKSDINYLTDNQENKLKSNDLVFNLMTKKAALVSKENGNKIISQNFAVIYPEKINKYYLLYLLNEDLIVRREINSLVEGSFNQRISLKNLNELSIKITSEEKQEKIGLLYIEMMIQKNKLLQQATLIEKATITILNKIKG